MEAIPRVVDELEGGSDRAAAVLGSAFLDDQLAELLRTRLRGGRSTEGRLLEQDRPLSSFSARIEVAYGFGLISKGERDDLHLIRRIRNRFAHQVTAFDFEAAGVEDRVHSLECPDLMQDVLVEDRHSSKSRTRFVNAVVTLMMVLPGRIRVTKEAGAPTTLEEAVTAVVSRISREAQGGGTTKNGVEGEDPGSS